MQKVVSLLSFILSLFASKYLFSDCRGKVDVAPAFVHLDILNFGKTVKTMDLPAIKADANYLIYKGLCIKPGVLYGSNRGRLFTGGLGLGFALPYKRWCFTPSIGANYTAVKTQIPIDFGGIKFKACEKFHSWSPYISLEVFYRIMKNWRAGFQVQYAWSRSHTTIKGLGSDKSNAKGPSYALVIERDFCEHWSLNLGAAYNISLTREKHGLRGYGMKLGLARWF
jgi:hypothetical protein